MKTKRYSGVRGKVVRYVESVAENGELIIGIQFTDETYLAFIVGSQVRSRAELLRVRRGNEIVLKKYKPHAYEKELAREERTGKPKGF